MGRLLRTRAGRFIEYQSHATPGTLTRNALAAGWLETDIEEIEATPLDAAAAIAAQEVVPPLRAFRNGLLDRLDGATPLERLSRAQQLRQDFPGLTEPFLTAIAGDVLTPEAARWVKAVWVKVTARVGLAAGEVITAAERDRILALDASVGLNVLSTP